MTRAEAIQHVWQLSYQVGQEFCCGEGEMNALEEDTYQALLALGCSEDEINEA